MKLSIDWSLFYVGAIELLITLIMSLLVVIVGFKSFSLFTRKLKENSELKKNNFAVGILSGSVIVSMGILVRAAIDPTITTFRILISNGVTLNAVLLSIAFFLMFFIIAGIISIIVVLFSSMIYTKLTKDIDEYTEIGNNNIAIAIVLGAVLVSVSILVQDGVVAMLSGIQPWPGPLNNPDIPTKVGSMIKNNFDLIKSFINC